MQTAPPSYGQTRRAGFTLGSFTAAAARLVLVLAAYSLSRAFFALTNPTLLEGASAGQVAEAFGLGLRYDLSTALSVNLPYIAVALLPFGWMGHRNMRRGLRLWFVATNTLFLLTDLADAEYAKYTGRRTGMEVLGILPDLADQAPQLAGHFFYIPLIALALGLLLWKLYGRRRSSGLPLPLGLGVALYLGVLVLAVLGIRGSVGLRPLAPAHAYALQPAQLGTLALNTPFVFFKSIQAESAPTLAWAGTPEEARRAFAQPPVPAPRPQLPGYNVVVLLLESFGTEYTGLEGGRIYTPFLDSLAHAGTWMPHFYANGRRSIEALPAVFAQLPSLLEEALISGPYSTDRINGWPGVAAKVGYQTLFFHGGRNGTMGFDHFARQAGFRQYLGMSEYPERSRDYDGNWGIYDGPFLQFAAKALTATTQPFVAGIFTLSSHQPYAIEPGYAGRYPKGTLPIHESIGYADDALRRFFATARRQPWYGKTLFVLTADHTQMSRNPRYRTMQGAFDVPCIFFAPGRRIQLDTAQTRQHADIGPTVADLLGLPADSLGLFGSSMARPAPSRVLETIHGYFALMGGSDNTYIHPDGRSKSSLPTGDTAEAFRLLKAGSQAYTDGLRLNRLYR